MDEQDRVIERSRGKDGRIDKRMLHARAVLTDNNLFGPDDVNPDPLGGGPLVDSQGFAATGALDGRPYWIAVFWSGELGDLVQLRGWDAEWVTPVLQAHEDRDFEVAHPGRSCALRLDNALSILTALMHLSKDFHWSGDEPPGFPGSDRRPPMER